MPLSLGLEKGSTMKGFWILFILPLIIFGRVLLRSVCVSEAISPDGLMSSHAFNWNEVPWDCSAQHGVFDYTKEGLPYYAECICWDLINHFSLQVILSLRNASSKATSPHSAYLITKTPHSQPQAFYPREMQPGQAALTHACLLVRLFLLCKIVQIIKFILGIVLLVWGFYLGAESLRFNIVGSEFEMQRCVRE